MHPGDTTGDHERVTVPEAAERLGVSQRAVRARADRGTLEAEKDGEGRVWVYIPPHTVGDTAGATTGDTAGESALLRERAERIASLEAQLAAEREANRENRRIIAGLTNRIPQLEAPEEAPGDTGEKHSGREQGEAPERPAQRPERPGFWRRIFGGPE